LEGHQGRITFIGNKEIGVIKHHRQTIIHILGRMAGATFLKGHLVGRIGLSDPADTALGRRTEINPPDCAGFVFVYKAHRRCISGYVPVDATP
jgi:hypothetical protein